VGARYIAADYWDLLPCPFDIFGGSRARYQFYREWLTEDDVAHMFESGEFHGDFVEVPTSDWYSREDNWHKQLMQSLGWEQYLPGDKGMYEVIYRYEKGHVKTFINRGFIAQDTKLTRPTKPVFPGNVPFTDMRYIMFPMEYFGMGVAESLEQLQNDKNLVRSQHRENVDMNLNAVVKVDRNADVALDTIVFGPQALWLMENTQTDVDVWTPPDVTTQTVLQIENQIMQDMERAAGRTRYGMGQTPPHGRETATAILRLQQAGLARMDTQIRLTEAVTVRNLGMQLADILQNFLHDDIFEQIVGRPKDAVFEDTDKWDLKYRVDAQPLGASITQIKELRIEQMMRMLEIVRQIPPQMMELDPTQPFRVSYHEILYKTFQAFGFSREEVEKALPATGEGTRLGPGEQGAKPLQPGQLGTDEELAQIEAALRERSAQGQPLT